MVFYWPSSSSSALCMSPGAPWGWGMRLNSSKADSAPLGEVWAEEHGACSPDNPLEQRLHSPWRHQNDTWQWWHTVALRLQIGKRLISERRTRTGTPVLCPPAYTLLLPVRTSSASRPPSHSLKTFLLTLERVTHLPKPPSNRGAKENCSG